jgi:hypothetical protein
LRIGHQSCPASRCRRTICATPYPNNTPNIGNARPSTKVAMSVATTRSEVEPSVGKPPRTWSLSMK